MVLVDTSVWIDYINGTETGAVVYLDQLLLNPLSVGITSYIYMEILQGAKTEKDYRQFEKYFSGQKFYALKNQKKSYATAAKMYFDCRRQGITIRASIDCLIALCAIENDLILLHHDTDFCHMATVIKSLKTKSFL